MEVQENNAVFVVILWQDPIEYNARYAVLVGGVPIGSDPTDRFWAGVGDAYQLLTDKTKYNVPSTNVFVMFNNLANTTKSWNGNNIPIKAQCTEFDFEYVMDSFIRPFLTANDMLYIQINCHGNFFNQGQPDESSVTFTDASTFNSILNGEKHTLYRRDLSQMTINSMPSIKYARLIINIDACQQYLAVPVLSANNRIVMTANGYRQNNDPTSYKRYDSYSKIDDINCPAYLWEGKKITWTTNEPHPGFLQGLWDDGAQSIYYAFGKGWDATTNNYKDAWPSYNEGRSYPLLEDNIGDGDSCGYEYPYLHPSDQSLDGWLASHTYM